MSGGQNGVFHLGAPAISGNGSDKIEWIGHAYTCTLGLSAVDAKSTKVAISCGKPGDDAPDSFLTGQLRNRVIEAADANLTGRSYNPDEAKQLENAWRWPADTIHHATPAELSSGAMKQAMKNMEATARAEDAAEYHDDVPAAPYRAQQGSGGNPWAK